MSQLFHFSYISKLSPEYDATHVVDIIKVSRKNNIKDHITGILVYDGERFFQYIEGPKATVLNLLSRLKSDHRHVGMSILFENAHYTNRFYNDWHLAYTYINEKDYIDELKTLDYVEVINKIKNFRKELDVQP